MTEWFENTKLWEKLEPFLFHHIRTPQHTQTETEGILSILQLTPGASVVDLGCGIGRISLELAKRGYNVTGVDITPSFLEKAGKTAHEKNLKVHLIKEDMRRFKRPSTFDAAISIFSSFGYFQDPHHDSRVIQNIFDSLKSGGKIFLDLMGRGVLKRVYREQTKYFDEPTGTHLVQTSKIKGKWEWAETEWILIRGQHQKKYPLNIRIFSGDEIKKELETTGFKDVTLYGNFSGGPYNEKAERLIAIGTKF